MDPAQLSTLVIVAGLAAEKCATHFDLYSGVRHLHFGCSKCVEFDVDRRRTPTTGSPATVSGQFESQVSLTPLEPNQPPQCSASELEKIVLATVRRLSDPATLQAPVVATPPGSSQHPH